MQKGQSVIKLFIILLFFSNINVFSQERIKGKYFMVDGTGSHYINYSFNKNNTFEYEDGGHLGATNYGKGHYIIKKDSLVLNYDLTELKEESYFKFKKYYDFKDSIDIKINVFNFNKKLQNNIAVYCYPNTKSSKTLISKRTDEKGKAILKVKKSKTKEKIELHVGGTFLSTVMMHLSYDTNYTSQYVTRHAGCVDQPNYYSRQRSRFC